MQGSVKSFDGININYDIRREKNKNNFLVFLHGTGDSLKMWKKIRLFFHKAGIPTLAIDLRGHGKSGKPKLVENYNLKHFAKDVKAVLKKEHIFHPIIVGYSLGGMVTLTFHRLYPKLSKSYVIISSAYKPPKILTDVIKKFSGLIHFLNEKLGGAIPRKGAKGGFFKSLLFTLEGIASFNEKGIIKGITKPVLILSGGKDIILNVSNSKKISKMVKNSKLKIFPKENHIIIPLIPDKISNEIYSFIKETNIPIRKK